MTRPIIIAVLGVLSFSVDAGPSLQGGFDHEGEELPDPIKDPLAQEVLKRLTGPAPCEDGLAAGLFPCNGIDLVGYLSPSDLREGGTSGSNLWGFHSLNDDREYAVFGVNNGTSVVDVTDPASPIVVGSVPGVVSSWREVKVYQFFSSDENRYKAYAYVVSEGADAGLQILDLNDLPNSVSLAATYTGFRTAHTVFLSNVDFATMVPNEDGIAPVLYIEGSNNGGLIALDISDPVAPVALGRDTRSYAHDIWAGVLRGKRATGCAAHDPCELIANWTGNSLRLIDFTDKANPITLSTYLYPGLGYAHSGWVSADGNYLFAMDELDEQRQGHNTWARVIDIRDLSNPFVASTWTGPTRAIDHNGYTVGNNYYMANYERGITVLEVTTPEDPQEIAFFDTFPSADEAAFHGAWGVYPFLPSGTILVSNIDGPGGLFILRNSPP